MERAESFGVSLPLIGAVTGLVLVPVAWTAGWLADGGCPVMFHWASGIPIGWMGVLTALVGAAAFACAGRVIAATVRRGWRAVWAAAIAVAAAVALEATVPRIYFGAEDWAFFAVPLAALCFPAVLCIGSSRLAAERAPEGLILHAAHRRAMALDTAAFVVLVLAIWRATPRWNVELRTARVTEALLEAATFVALVAGAQAVADLVKVRRLLRAPSARDAGQWDAVLRGEARAARRPLAWSLLLAAVVVAGGALVIAAGPAGPPRNDGCCLW